MAAPTRLIALRNLTHTHRRFIKPRTTTEQYTRHVLARTYRTAKTRRTFSTATQVRAQSDNSTIDFAYLPDTRAEIDDEEIIRIPILPENYSYSAREAHVEDPEAVMKPEISTASADAVFSPVADLGDGHSLNIDFHAMADRVAMNLKEAKVSPEEQASMMKQIWNDMVDDMLGRANKSKGGSS